MPSRVKRFAGVVVALLLLSCSGDRLAAQYQARLPATAPFQASYAFTGTSAIIQSIQSCTITITSGNTSGTCTLATAVVKGNSHLSYNGVTQAQVANPNWTTGLAYALLTNGTTVTGTIGATGGTATIYVNVVEYKAGLIKSRQDGILSWTAAGGTSAVITAVNTGRAQFSMTGSNTYPGYSANTDEGAIGCFLASTTAVTCTHVATGGGSNVIGAYEVLEFVQ